MSQPTPASEPQAQSTAHQQRYETLRSDLEKVVRRVCPPALSSRFDDFVQLAMLNVMAVEKKKTTSDVGVSVPNPKVSAGKGPLSSSYLYRVAYSVVVDEIRRTRRRSEVSLDGDDQESMNELSTAQDTRQVTPQKASESRELGRGIKSCIKRLNQHRRRAVTLYLLGHSVPEASRILQWNLKRTESLVYRGLADLRQCLSRKGLKP